MFISEPDEVHRQSRAAIQQLSAPVATSQFVVQIFYIRISLATSDKNFM